jgi:hypothetical protein
MTLNQEGRNRTKRAKLKITLEKTLKIAPSQKRKRSARSNLKKIRRKSNSRIKAQKRISHPMKVLTIRFLKRLITMI